jgi:hypothetical protein
VEAEKGAPATPLAQAWAEAWGGTPPGRFEGVEGPPELEVSAFAAALFFSLLAEKYMHVQAPSPSVPRTQMIMAATAPDPRGGGSEVTAAGVPPPPPPPPPPD